MSEGQPAQIEGQSRQDRVKRLRELHRRSLEPQLRQDSEPGKTEVLPPAPSSTDTVTVLNAGDAAVDLTEANCRLREECATLTQQLASEREISRALRTKYEAAEQARQVAEYAQQQAEQEVQRLLQELQGTRDELQTPTSTPEEGRTLDQIDGSGVGGGLATAPQVTTRMPGSLVSKPSLNAISSVQAESGLSLYHAVLKKSPMKEVANSPRDSKSKMSYTARARGAKYTDLRGYFEQPDSHGYDRWGYHGFHHNLNADHYRGTRYKMHNQLSPAVGDARQLDYRTSPKQRSPKSREAPGKSASPRPRKERTAKTAAWGASEARQRRAAQAKAKQQVSGKTRIAFGRRASIGNRWGYQKLHQGLTANDYMGAGVSSTEETISRLRFSRSDRSEKE